MPAGDLENLLELHHTWRDKSVPSWTTLGALERIDVLHSLCEWQLEVPERLRRDTTDEDTVSWRVNPAGWDRTGNTYWLFDGTYCLTRQSPLDTAASSHTPQADKKARTETCASHTHNSAHHAYLATRGLLFVRFGPLFAVRGGAHG